MRSCARLGGGGSVGVLVAVLALGTSAMGQCSADTDGDTVVDVSDLISVIDAWGPCPKPCPADLDGNGVVDVVDLLTVIEQWGPCLESGTFPDTWISGGPACGFEPSIQVHAYNPDFYILRQSLCTNFEGPFMYLIFGDEKVLMQDTGAGGIPIADTVDGIIDQWLADRNQESIELIVSHSHGHGDHVAGDGQFAGDPGTTVVGVGQGSVASFFGITDWPEQIVSYDLGNRVIDVIPIPGHQSAHVALYDRRTGLLLTGDSLYPGRLYISNFDQYLASNARLVQFIQDRPLTWVLGTHIEMTNTDGEDFPFGATDHPDEHPLQLRREHLLELYQGVLDMHGDPQIEVHDSFIIWPL